MAATNLTIQEVMGHCIRLLRHPAWRVLNMDQERSCVVKAYNEITALVSPELKRNLVEYPEETMGKWAGEQLKRLKLQFALLDCYHRSAQLEVSQSFGDELKEGKPAEIDGFTECTIKKHWANDQTRIWHIILDLLKIRQEVCLEVDVLEEMVEACDRSDASLNAVAHQAQTIMWHLSPNDREEVDKIRTLLSSLGLQVGQCGLP